MRSSDWSSDVCSSDLGSLDGRLDLKAAQPEPAAALRLDGKDVDFGELLRQAGVTDGIGGPLELAVDLKGRGASPQAIAASLDGHRSEEHTSELQSLMRISYAVFCLKKKK